MKLSIILLFYFNLIFSQYGIGTVEPNINALLHLESSNKGLLLTRVPLTETSSPSPLQSHVEGIIVYNTSSINDVVPGIYFNNGMKWNYLCDTSTLSALQSQLNSIDAQVTVKRAIIVAGQSNTHFGATGNVILPSDFSSKGMLQLGRGNVNYQEVPLTFYNGYHHSQQADRASFAAMFCYHYYNKLKVDFPNKNVKLLLIPCGAGGSGWSKEQYEANNSWRTDASYWNDLIARIKWAKANGYQIDAFLWHQGEADAQDGTINYKYILYNFIQSVREQVGNQSLPFILGEMVPNWVAQNLFGNYQDIINDVPNDVPYTFTVSGDNLTYEDDQIHYSAKAQYELGQRYYDGYANATLNPSPSNYTNSIPSPGEYRLLEHNSYIPNSNTGRYFETIFHAISTQNYVSLIYPGETDDLYSRLGDIWRYKNADGYYHFKVKAINVDGNITGIFEWKQRFNPFGLNEMNFEDRNDCVVLNNTIGINTVSGQGFASLVYDVNGSSTLPKTLFHADVRSFSDKWWFSIGQVLPFSYNNIPLIDNNNSTKHIKLYAIKD